MKLFKKFAIAMATVTLAGVLALGFGADEAYAAEGNQTYEGALSFTEATPIKDRLNDNYKDTNWFTYTVEKETAFNFKLTNQTSNTQVTWYLDVYDSEVNRIDSFVMKSGYLSVESDLYTFPIGEKLYVHVAPCKDTKDVEYKLAVVYDDADNWAVEHNDLPSTATVVKAGDKYLDVLNYTKKRDVDWYKYVAPADAEVCFVLDDVNKVQFNIGYIVLDANEKKLGDGSFRGYDDGYKFSTKTYSVKKGDVLYLKLFENASAKGRVFEVSVDEKLINPDDLGKIDVPYAAVAGTNIVVGKADNAGATVFVTYKNKTYSAVADENGIYKVVTAKLAKNKKITIWQEYNKEASVKRTVKITKK